MTAEQYLELAKSLGVAAPLVAVLLIQLRQSQEERAQAQQERKEITAQFVTALSTAIQANTGALTRAAESMTDLSAAVREGAAQNRDEHNRIVAALGQVQMRERP